MQVTFNLGPQSLYENRWRKGKYTPSNGFHYSKQRAQQKHTNVPVEARPAGLRGAGTLRVAQVIFDKSIPEDMDPVHRMQVMENVVMLCEVKWQELYGS
jgi:hypothetical protein